MLVRKKIQAFYLRLCRTFLANLPSLQKAHPEAVRLNWRHKVMKGVLMCVLFNFGLDVDLRLSTLKRIQTV